MNMNRNNNSDGYWLADKMKYRFQNLGAEVQGRQATPTPVLMRYAQAGNNPNFNCSQLEIHPQGTVRGRPRPAPDAVPANAGGARVRPDARAQSRPGTAPSGRPSGAGNPPRPQAEASGAPRKANPNAPKNAGASGRPRPNTASANGSANVRNTQTNRSGGRPKSGAGKKSGFAATWKNLWKARPATAAEEITEVRAEGRRMTPMFAVFVVVGTLMIMSLIVSFSDNYQIVSDIDGMKSQLSAMEQTAEKLELELELKNDIRVIERIATEELGMVKADAVKRKYLPLSDGERIDLIEEKDAAQDTPATGVLLSSFWSSLGSLFDYFR